MSGTDCRKLIDRGRKAGLGTFELYAALNARRPEASDQAGQTDGNGYVPNYGGSGRPQYYPMARSRNG